MINLFLIYLYTFSFLEFGNSISQTRGKGVWLSVYVEKPSKRKSVSRNHHHHYHHHHHLYVHSARKLTGNNGGGYSRKAQLLEYSRQLRESARSQANSPLLQPNPKPASQDHHQNLSQVPISCSFYNFLTIASFPLQLLNTTYYTFLDRLFL